MKIFATSDIHGNRVIMDKLKEIASEADLLLICGDIGGKSTWEKTFQQFSDAQKQDAAYLNRILNNISKESYFILGNDDWFEYSGKHYLRRPVEISGDTLIPFELVLLTPFNTNREANENKISYELMKIPADHRSIMVAHTPPLGAGDILYNGEHCGSHSVRKWIEQIQPKLWLCGHIHENNSTSWIGKTLVLNCACWYTDGVLRGWLIDTETMEYKSVCI